MFTWLSFGSAQPSKVAQFSVGANIRSPLARRHAQAATVALRRCACRHRVWRGPEVRPAPHLWRFCPRRAAGRAAPGLRRAARYCATAGACAGPSRHPPYALPRSLSVSALPLLTASPNPSLERTATGKPAWPRGSCCLSSASRPSRLTGVRLSAQTLDALLCAQISASNKTVFFS